MTDRSQEVEGLFREEKKLKKRKKTAKATLSFALDEDEGDESGNASQNGDEPPVKRPKSRKNPEVDTSFLPDREREEAERREREQLRQEWLRKQEELKAEDIEITYSYWDGSGHRKSVMVGLLAVECLRGGPDHVDTCMWNPCPGHIVQEGRNHHHVPREVSSAVPRTPRRERRQSDVCEGMRLNNLNALEP